VDDAEFLHFQGSPTIRSTATTWFRSRSCRSRLAAAIYRDAEGGALGSPPIESIRAAVDAHRRDRLQAFQREEAAKVAEFARKADAAEREPGTENRELAREDAAAEASAESVRRAASGGLTHGCRENVRLLPHRTMRTLLISLSHRRSLARLAVRSPLTRPVVARFVAGQTLDEALPAIAALKRAGLRTTVDVLGESVTSPEHAAAAVDRYLATIAALSERGLDPNVSVKLSQMGLEIDRGPVPRQRDADRRRGPGRDGFVRFDMEDHAWTDATLEIWRAAHDAYPQVGVVIQSALRRSSTDVDAIIAAGRSRPALQRRLRRAGQRGLSDQVGRGRQLRSADGAAAPRRRRTRPWPRTTPGSSPKRSR
jgi:hypothetical protein